MLEKLKVIQQCPLRLATNNCQKSTIKYGKEFKLLKTEFESESVYDDNDKYIKTKIKIYDGSMVTNFQSKKNAKRKAPFKCLPITMLDSVIEAKKKYYPQTLLEECKYDQEKIKMDNLIDDDLEKKFV